MTGVVGAAVIAVVLVFATGVMQYVPQPTLGAIVIAAALSLADIPATRRLWHQRRTEFGLSIAAFLGVALLGVLPGILLAITLSILNVFRRVWWPHQAELGRVEGLGRPARHRHATRTSELLPGLVVYRFDAPLIFANSRMFGDTVRAMAEEQSDLRWVIVAAEPMTDVDTTAADMLAELDAWLNARGVSLVFAEVKDPVREKIQRYELERTIDPAHFYPTIDEAVAAYMAETGAHLARHRGGAAGGATVTEQAERSTGPTTPAAGCRVARLRRAWRRGLVFLVVVTFRRWDVLLAGLATLAVLVVAAVVRRVAAWHDPDDRARGRRRVPGAVRRRHGGQPAACACSWWECCWSPSRPGRPGSPCGRPPSTPRRCPQRPRPRHAVLIMNPWSGGGKVEKFELERLCRERGIEPIVLVQGIRPARARRGRRAARRRRASAWPAVTARRRSWRRWRAGTASRSS